VTNGTGLYAKGLGLLGIGVGEDLEGLEGVVGDDHGEVELEDAADLVGLVDGPYAESWGVGALLDNIVVDVEGPGEIVGEGLVFIDEEGDRAGVVGGAEGGEEVVEVEGMEHAAVGVNASGDGVHAGAKMRLGFDEQSAGGAG
jgi:hypothetical protein